MKSMTIRPAVIATLAVALMLNFTLRIQAQTTATNAPAWESSAAAGLTLTRGNSKTLQITANLQSQFKTSIYETLLGADATYGKDNGVKNAESLHGFGQYNRFFTDKWYFGLRLDGIHDAIADVKYRITLAPLIGYYFIKETNTSLSAEVGPAFVTQRQGNLTKNSANLRLGERFEHKFNDKAKLWQSFEILPQVDRFNNYYFNAEIGVESALTTHLALRSYIQDTFYNIPAPGRQKNDVKLVTALAYKF